MIKRLVPPLVFVVALVALAFVMQALGNSSPTEKTLTGPELLKSFEIMEIAPPKATVTDKDGKQLDLGSLLTKPTFLTFWSIYCGECEIGLSVLDEFAKSQSRVAVMMVSVKNEPKDVEEKLKALNITLGTYFDLDGSAAESWEATTMPASYYFVGGKLKYFFPGRVSKEHLDALLAVQ